MHRRSKHEKTTTPKNKPKKKENTSSTNNNAHDNIVPWIFIYPCSSNSARIVLSIIHVRAPIFFLLLGSFNANFWIHYYVPVVLSNSVDQCILMYLHSIHPSPFIYLFIIMADHWFYMLKDFWYLLEMLNWVQQSRTATNIANSALKVCLSTLLDKEKILSHK